MGVYNFQEDLKEGHKAEEAVLKYVRKEHPNAYRVKRALW